MKNLDRIFVLMLIVLPFSLAVILAISMLRNPNVAPEDTDARGVTPTVTFAVFPLTVSPTATPTYQDTPVTPTATATYVVPSDPAQPQTSVAPTVTTVVRDTSTPVVTTAGQNPRTEPSVSLTPSPAVSVITNLPDTSGSAQEDIILPILVVSISVASIAGGLLVLGKILRAKQQ